MVRNYEVISLGYAAYVYFKNQSIELPFAYLIISFFFLRFVIYLGSVTGVGILMKSTSP